MVPMCFKYFIYSLYVFAVLNSFTYYLFHPNFCLLWWCIVNVILSGGCAAATAASAPPYFRVSALSTAPPIRHLWVVGAGKPRISCSGVTTGPQRTVGSPWILAGPSAISYLRPRHSRRTAWACRPQGTSLLIHRPAVFKLRPGCRPLIMPP